MQWLWDLPANVGSLAWKGTAGLLTGSAFQGQPAQQIPIPKPFKFEDFAAVYQSSPYVKLAGISGALAVSLSAYYAHKMSRHDEAKRSTFAVGLQQHFYHSLALLAVPLVKRSKLAGSFFLIGIVLFCGACYGSSALENPPPSLQNMAPFGGFAFIFGWLSMII